MKEEPRMATVEAKAGKAGNLHRWGRNLAKYSQSNVDAKSRYCEEASRLYRALAAAQIEAVERGDFRRSHRLYAIVHKSALRLHRRLYVTQYTPRPYHKVL